MTDQQTRISNQQLRVYLAIAFLSVLILKLMFGSVLDLYSDEIFYWHASLYPAIAYSDLPFMAAFLSGSGTALLGNSAIAVRSLFMLMGSAIPFLIYWLAAPVLSRRQALEAAGLSLCLPLCGFLGLLAVPDVPLLFFGLLFIGFFERATRTGLTRYWIATGITAALGISTHYRFALYLLAAFICLLAFSNLRLFWKSLGLWIAATILLLGLYPTLSFNLTNQLSGIDYHLLERHPWRFQAEGLLHILKQAVLVTPLLYGALLLTLYRLLRAASQGDQTRGLFAVFALCNLGVYVTLAPWTDSTRTSIHWPLSGYLPLLVFLPETLRYIYALLNRRYTPKTSARVLSVLVGMGFAGTLVALIGVGSQGFQAQLRPLIGPGILSNKMAGWRELNHYVDNLISNQHMGRHDIVVTDNYYTAAQLELGNPALHPVYNIDEDKSIRDGRAVQYQLWQLNGNALKELVAPSGLFITEDSELTVPDKIMVLQRACSNFESLQLLSQLSLFGGEKRFSFYRADDTSQTDKPCPLPSLGWVDQPEDKALIAGDLLVSGWVINEGAGVHSVELILDGSSIGMAQYGSPRPDVEEAMGVRSDPNAPNLGFAMQIPKSELAAGEHQLQLKTTSNSGEEQVFGQRRIFVQ